MQYNWYSSKEHQNFAMNDLYLFFWGDFSIQFFDLRLKFKDEHLQTVNFRICHRESCKIKELKVGNNPNIIVIIVSQN